MSFFDRKRGRKGTQSYQSKKEDLDGKDRKAKRKEGHRHVELEPGDMARDGAWLKLLVDQALSTVIKGLPAHQRQDWDGNVDPKQNKTQVLVPVVLRHKRSRGVKIEASLTVPAAVMRVGDPDRARKYGVELGETLLMKLRRWKSDFRQEYGMDMESFQKVPTEIEGDLCGNDSAPDMTEALAVAELLDRTRCAICDFTDLDYPDWGDECSHTEEERNGD